MIAPADFTLAALPAGYDARPATLDDLPGTVATLNAAARALLGVDTHTTESWARDWQMPGFDLATDTQLVLAPDGSAAGYANVWDLDQNFSVGGNLSILSGAGADVLSLFASAAGAVSWSPMSWPPDTGPAGASPPPSAADDEFLSGDDAENNNHAPGREHQHRKGEKK